MSEFAVKGLKETLDVLAQLGPRIERQAIRSGLTAAAGVVRDDARARIARKTGLTSRAIRSGSPRQLQNGSYSISVSVSGNKHAFLGLFIEYGVSPHLIKVREEDKPTITTRRGERKMSMRMINRGFNAGSLRIGEQFVGPVVHHPGFAARPFLRPALEAKASEAVEAMRIKIVAVVESKTGFNIPAAIAA